MSVKSRSDALVHRPVATFAPRIYYFHPLLAGPLGSWPQHLRRVQEMGFDTVLTAPLFAPGASGDFFSPATMSVRILRSPPRRLRIRSSANRGSLRGQDLPFMDVVLGRVAPDAKLAACAPNGFRPSIRRPQRVDPRGSLAEPDAAYGRFDEPRPQQQLAEWWIERLRRLTAAGVAGFGCRDPHLVPAPIWRQVTDRGSGALSRLPVSGLDARPDLDANRRAPRKRFRCRLFLRRLVGWSRTMVRRRARIVARDRRRYRLAGSAVRTTAGAQTAKHASGAAQRIGTC